MGIRFVRVITLGAAIIGSMMIASGNRNILVWALTPVCWILAISASLMGNDGDAE